MSALDDRIAALLAKRERAQAADIAQRRALIRKYDTRAASLLRDRFGDLVDDARFEVYPRGDFDPNRRFRVHLGDLPVFDAIVAAGHDSVVFIHDTVRTVRLDEMLLHLVDLTGQDAPALQPAAPAQQAAR